MRIRVAPSWWFSPLGLTLLLWPGLSATAADGAALYKAKCVSCHGPAGGGNAAMQAPPLAGSDADYVVRQLRHFRSHVRGGETPQGPVATMQAMAAALPDDDAVLALGRYIGSMKAPKAQGGATESGPSLNVGKGLFGICVACHGSQAEGNPSLSAPRLNHLPAWYLTGQLQAYRAGVRGQQPNDPLGQQMRQVATEALPDEEAVNAVAAYITTLGRKPR